jgi:ankyrin repeat protein
LKTKQSLLHHAVNIQDDAMVKFLIGKQCNLNVISHSHRTAMMDAIRLGRYDYVDLFLAQKDALSAEHCGEVLVMLIENDQLTRARTLLQTTTQFTVADLKVALPQSESLLRETTMDAEARVLHQVKISHADDAEEVFSTLMGDLVEPRRDFIQSNALKVANLDV